LPTDGNTFTESGSGERSDLFASISFGMAAGYSRVVLTYRYHGVTALTDLESRDVKNENDFGTIMFTVFIG